MNKYDKNELERLILEQKKSYSSIGKIYGVSGAAIKKVAKILEIELPRRRVINKNENFSHKGFKKTSLVNKISDEEFIDIIKTSVTWKEIGKKLGYKHTSLNVKLSIEERCSKLGVELNISKDNESEILNKTKKELFENRKNWQSARSTIRKIASIVYKSFYPELTCKICGYSKHVEIAHIKPVSEFDGNATIREINSIDNLIGLCPNHHWEYDNGVIEI